MVSAYKTYTAIAQILVLSITLIIKSGADMTDKQKQQQGKNGKAGTYTGAGFQPRPQQQPKKSISLLDILLGRK